jgi:hypothetical protein
MGGNFHRGFESLPLRLMGRRLAILVLLPLVALASGCAGAFPGTPTYISDVRATINGFVGTTEGGTTY